MTQITVLTTLPSTFCNAFGAGVDPNRVGGGRADDGLLADLTEARPRPRWWRGGGPSAG